MILSDRDIRNRLDRDGGLEIEPIERDEQIQPASVDLRLGHSFKMVDPPPVRKIVPGEMEPSYLGGDKVDKVRLWRNEECPNMILAPTLERVRIPDDLVATVEGRSSLGRMGIIVHSTAGFVDPGFEGQITLEISSLIDSSFEFEPGMRICQLAFHELSSPCDDPYDGKYQNQEGPVGSRINEEMS